MRRVFEWVAINAFFVAMSCVFAGVFLALGLFARDLAHDAPLIGYVVGVVALAVTLLLAHWVMGLIARRPLRHPARGRG